MRVRDRRFTENPRLMIIPMIDIIFFLLVFFMMSTMFMIEQRVLPVTLPAAAAAQTDMARAVPVTVLADGSVRMEDRPLSLEELAAEVRRLAAADGTVRFVVRGDRAAEYGSVVRVLDLLRMAGVQKLSIAVDPLP